MTGLIELAIELQEFLLEQDFKFCFIGGLAVQYWGEPRFTKDIDLTILSGFNNEERVISPLMARYVPRVKDACEFAIQYRVLLLQNRAGIGIDISLGGLPFEENAVNRALMCEVLRGKRLKLCTAEDLIIMKAFASRDQDWLDVKQIIAKQGRDAFDWKYIEQELTVLSDLKEEPEIIYRLETLRRGSPIL